MTRVLALLAAVALIVGAVVVRGVLDDDGSTNGGGDQPDHALRVVCGEEMRAACDALTAGDYVVLVEPTTTTADRLTDAPANDPGLDVWVAPSPWPEMVDGTRERAGLPTLFATQDPLARSLLAAVVPETLGVCSWECLGDRAATDLRIGGRPLDSGIGLVHLAAFASGRLGTTDFASNDLDSATQGWLRAIAENVDEVTDPVTRMLLIRASYDVALSYGAEAENVLAAASEDRRAGLKVAYPEPMVPIIAVAAAVEGASVPTELAGGLRATGWAEALEEPIELPPAGVLTALLDVIG